MIDDSVRRSAPFDVTKYFFDFSFCDNSFKTEGQSQQEKHTKSFLSGLILKVERSLANYCGMKYMPCCVGGKLGRSAGLAS